MDIAEFKKLPVMGILRGVESFVLEPLIEAVVSTGLKTIEITMNTRDAALLIRQAVKLAAGRLCIGAGTVLDLNSLRSALDAGATFIVTPVLIKEVTGYCVKNKIPVFPGALTPQEIYDAWQSGAAMVKVFPAKVFGPGYFKELKGPFNDIELLACGGITVENMRSYFENGASAVSFGASVFKKELLEKRDFKGIARNINTYLTGSNLSVIIGS
jgi:2-dehydro-3-deoxyphosphogluconate aldolase / (4S)-4-hydroxy-2-oxoglutarate aldolase